jgi:hypothetical protein
VLGGEPSAALFLLEPRLGLGGAAYRIGSMGGYGAILFSEKYPTSFSPSLPSAWRSEPATATQMVPIRAHTPRRANSPMTTPSPCRRAGSTPVRVASGYSDRCDRVCSSYTHSHAASPCEEAVTAFTGCPEPS